MRLWKVRIKQSDIICFLLFFSIVKIHAVPQVVQQTGKILSLCIVLLFLIKKSFYRLWNEGLFLGVILIVPSFIGVISGNLTTKVFLDGILNAICIFCMYSFIQYVSERKLLKHTVFVLFFYNVAVCLISAVSVFLQGRSMVSSGTTFTYFFGNKFATLYLFLLLIGLTYAKFYDKQKQDIRHKPTVVFLIFFEIFMSHWVQCSTTMLAGVVMMLVVLLSGKRTRILRKKTSKPAAAVVYLILPGVIALNIVTIMRIPVIYAFVTGVLGKSAGLTGRTYIYSHVVDIFLENPIFGYGYNSDMAYKVTLVGNAQNGLFQMLLEFGILGVIAVSVMVYRAFAESENMDTLWGIKVFIFAMCVCSIVEISINYLFYMSVFLLRFAYAYDSAGAVPQFNPRATIGKWPLRRKRKRIS